MRRLRFVFALLFVGAIILSSLHNIVHEHDLSDPSQESCPMYLLSHTPAITPDPINHFELFIAFILFIPPLLSTPKTIKIPSKSRSPPVA